MQSTPEIEIEKQIRSQLGDPRLIERMLEQGKEAVHFWLPEQSLAPIIYIATYDVREPNQLKFTICSVQGGFNGPEKPLIMAQLGREMYAKRLVPLAITLASEAWRASEKLNPDGSRRYAQPADDPEREEVITLQVLTADGQAAVTFCGAERKDGMLHLAGDWEPVNRDIKSRLLSTFFVSFLGETSLQKGPVR